MKKIFNLLKSPICILLLAFVIFKILPSTEFNVILLIMLVVSFLYIIIPCLFYVQARQSVLYNSDFFVSLMLCLVVVFFLVVNNEMQLIGLKWYNWASLIKPQSCLFYMYYILVYSISYFTAKQKSITKK